MAQNVLNTDETKVMTIGPDTVNTPWRSWVLDPKPLGWNVNIFTSHQHICPVVSECFYFLSHFEERSVWNTVKSPLFTQYKPKHITVIRLRYIKNNSWCSQKLPSRVSEGSIVSKGLTCLSPPPTLLCVFLSSNADVNIWWAVMSGRCSSEASNTRTQRAGEKTFQSDRGGIMNRSILRPVLGSRDVWQYSTRQCWQQATAGNRGQAPAGISCVLQKSP